MIKDKTENKNHALESLNVMLGFQNYLANELKKLGEEPPPLLFPLEDDNNKDCHKGG